jgi:hypothetical protein
MEAHSDEFAMNTRAVSLLLELLFTQVLYDGGCPALMGVVSRFEREFLSLESGGTRNRTGDTMIFSHIPRPLGMRETRISKRIRDHRVPLDTA